MMTQTTPSKRDLRQKGMVEAWWRNGGVGCLAAVTGFGKTRLGLRTIKGIRKLKPGCSVAVVVPTLPLQEQWKELVEEAGFDRVEVVVVNTLNNRLKQAPIHYDLVIYDEIHNYASLEFIRVLNELSYTYALGLSATLERSDQRHHLITRKLPLIDSVEMKEALAEGYVAPFRVFNLGLPLPRDAQQAYDKISTRFNSAFAFFNHDFDLAMSCLDKGAAMRFSDRTGHDLTKIVANAANFGNAMRQRKEILFSNERKALITKEILDKLPNKRFLTFSESLTLPLLLTKMMPRESHDYGSHLPKEPPKTVRKTKQQKISRKELLERLKDPNDPLRGLHTARALNEGADIDGLEVCIICSGSSSVRADLQRTGRGIRFSPDKQAIIINLYFLGTQDERWLRARQKKTIAPIWVQSVKQLLDHLNT